MAARYRVKVDRMGRVTIPKAVRERLGIREGTILELEVREVGADSGGVYLGGEVIVARVLVR